MRVEKLLTGYFLRFFLLPIFLGAYTGVKSQVVYEQYSKLEDRLSQGKDTVFIINFWATWCKPCVEELPWFNSFENSEFPGHTIKVLLVSMDFKKHLTDEVIPFIKEKKIEKEVILLADPDMNTWIPKINKEWDGAIPVTWFYTSGKESLLITRAVNNLADLNMLVKNYINKP